MKITIETIPHADQRYETAGDWWFDEAGDLQIRVSEMGNWRYEALVGFHELAEVLLCKSRGITQETVDEFDKQCEAEEPGDHPDAPYRREHFFATSVEWLLAAELGVDWNAYAAAVNAFEAGCSQMETLTSAVERLNTTGSYRRDGVAPRTQETSGESCPNARP